MSEREIDRGIVLIYIASKGMLKRKSMNANFFIIIGTIAAAIAAFSLPYGFYLKSLKENLQINVNIDTKKDRELNDKSKSQLIDIITKNQGKEIDITSVLGDQEAFTFATKIKEFLESKGYKVESVNQAIYTKPIKGQVIDQSGKKLKIIIGSKE